MSLIHKKIEQLEKQESSSITSSLTQKNDIVCGFKYKFMTNKH